MSIVSFIVDVVKATTISCKFGQKIKYMILCFFPVDADNISLIITPKGENRKKTQNHVFDFWPNFDDMKM